MKSEVKPLNVCMILSGYPPNIGGAERYASDLAKTLVKKGHTVDVLTRAFGDAPALEIDGRLTVRRLSVTGLPGLKLAVFFIRIMLEVFRKRKEIDVIKAYHTFSPGLVALIMGRIFGKPVVIRDGPSLYTIKMNTSNPVVRRMLTYTLRNVEEVYVDHQDTVTEYLKLGARDGHIVCLENPVDVEEFRPKKSGVKSRLNAEGKFLILCLGRLEKYKGIDYLIKAMPSILKKAPEAMLLLVGYGPEEANLRQLTRELGLEKSVNFFGKVSFEEASSFYAAADVFVQPSISGELPNTILQSMATGNAILTTRKVGSSKIVTKDRVVIVREKSQEEISEGIIRLYKDKALRERLGKSARSFAVRELSWDSHSNKVLGIYMKAINS